MFTMELTDEQLELMLATLAEKHIILYMQGKDNADMERLIGKFNDALKKVKKEYIFFKVFQELKK